MIFNSILLAAVVAAGTPYPPPVSATPVPVTSAVPSPAPPASPTPAPGRRLSAFSVSADQIAFYSNRYVVGAEGHVKVELGDGTRVSGNTLSMDLRLNRLLIAGDVSLTAPGAPPLAGAAFSEFFDFDRAYFIPIQSQPDRWTFAAGDYAHPFLGRQMPGDTFFLPDLSGERVFLYARRATIDPHQSVRFTPASLNFGLGAYIQFPSYFLNFSPNPNFAQNALPGAYVDGPLDFAGGEHGLVTAHVRYDSLNQVYPAVEAHQVSANHYIVGSVSPLTRPFKQYTVLISDRLTPALQLQVALQENAFQHGFARPLSATAVAQARLTLALPHSYLELQTANYYDSLLAQPAPGVNNLLYYGDPSHNWVPDHPFNAQLSWIGNRQKVLSLPLTAQFRSSFGYVHNGLTPLQTLGGVAYPSEYYKAVGFNVATQSLTLRRSSLNTPDLYVTASFDKQRQFFSIPHFVDTQTVTLALTHVLVPNKLTLVASYINQNLGDYYGAQQSLAYPPPTPGSQYLDPVTGQVIPGYGDFRGFGTTRSLVQQLVWTPSTDFDFNVTMRESRDYPRPVAGPTSIVGATSSFLNIGEAPHQADLDARYRLTPSLVLDAERSYYFNFGGYERWSPRFYVQLVR